MSPFCRHGERFRKVKCPPQEDTRSQTQVCRLLVQGLPPAAAAHPACPPLPCAPRNITEMMTTVSLQIVGVIEPISQHADWFFPGGMWQQLTWSQPLRGSGSLL